MKKLESNGSQTPNDIKLLYIVRLSSYKLLARVQFRMSKKRGAAYPKIQNAKLQIWIVFLVKMYLCFKWLFRRHVTTMYTIQTNLEKIMEIKITCYSFKIKVDKNVWH